MSFAQQVPQQLMPSVEIEDQDFGYAVDLDGDVAIVGAFRDDDGILLETGAVFVYRFDGNSWVEEAKLEAGTIGILDWFGWDVALSGDVLLASARNGDAFANNGGQVYVFRYNGNTWVEEDILTPSDGEIGDFGFAVDVEGDLAVVGASGRAGTVGGEGGAYVYRFNGVDWVEEDLLLGSDLSLQSFFGNDVAIDGNRMLVSAFNADDSTSNQAGKLYVFDYDGAQWQESAVLQSNNSNNIANLGVSVDLEGDWAIGGAPLDNELSSGAGAAFVYRFDGATWQFHSKLTAFDGDGFFLFGSSVDISGNRLLITADNWFPDGGTSSGKAYLFEYDDINDLWEEVDGFVPAGVSVGAAFGHAAAMQGEVMIIGAPEHSGAFDDSGTAFIYGAPMVATSNEAINLVNDFRILGPYPNPFSTSTTIELNVPASMPVQVLMYDMLGREVAQFPINTTSANRSHIQIDGASLAPGIYLLRVVSAHITETKRITLIK